ncbi:DUF5984 family protein [Nocardia sp. AG03]|uniref:DUF5984 family protein n=1 Tax=Nocardia sp. AG03 TaxID=3025312 RepID=UPI0024182AE8|nr:DUF5984 family protein [Nocardia sp. AG03]
MSDAALTPHEPNPGAMRFRFELDPVEEVVPWGEQRRLHWFGLTQGHYCMDIGGVGLLKYTQDHSTRDARSWVDYYVVRLWEDLLAVLPSALEPVPEDLAHFFAANSAHWVDTDDPRTDAATDAYGLRWTDTAHLRYGPSFRWWRTLAPEDTITVAWHHPLDPDGEIEFSAPPSGRRTIPTTEFLAAVTDFDRRLLDAMRERIDQLTETGVAEGIELDIPALIEEQAQRRTWLPRALASQDLTDWPAVRTGVAILSPSH